MEDKILDRKEAQELANKILEDKQLIEAEQLIIDNKIEFEHNGNKYRVRPLTLKEKDELASLKIKKLNSMLQEKDENGNFVYLTKKKLAELYKERGIDIDKLDEEIKLKLSELRKIYLEIGQSLADKDSKTILNNYKDKVLQIRNEINILELQKIDLFKCSLEEQLLDYESKMITYLTTEIYAEGKWEKAFNTYEEFISCEDEDLLIKAGTRTMLLQYL